MDKRLYGLYAPILISAPARIFTNVCKSDRSSRISRIAHALRFASEEDMALVERVLESQIQQYGRR